MKFTKMHGLGNDYVYVDGFREVIEAPADLARSMADRHFGIGGDGLILIRPPESDGADCRMEMYNADGSRAEMCGNGLRCVAKYAYDHAIARQPVLHVETDSGVKQVRVIASKDGLADWLEVDMGPPQLARAALPMADGADPATAAIGVPLELGPHTFRITAVSMGNPHIVVRLDDPAEPPVSDLELGSLDLRAWGPRFERHPWFPQRVNTEFIRPRSRREMDVRVWERGSGETLACGTGACAALVAAVLNDWVEPDVVVHLPGGDLRVRWDRPGNGSSEGRVSMSGPAVEVFTGEWPA